MRKVEVWSLGVRSPDPNGEPALLPPPRPPPNSVSKNPRGCAGAAAVRLRDVSRSAIRGAAAAAQRLQVGIEPIEIRAHALNAIVEVVALGRLAAAEQKEAGSFAAGALGLRHRTVELALLCLERLLVAADLLGARIAA